MAKRKIKPLHWILIVTVIFIIVLVVLKNTGVIGKPDEEKASVEKVTKRTLVETVLANGKIQPETELKISSEVSGEIVGLYVKEGDSVNKGQLLVKINPELILAAIDRAQAALNNSETGVLSARARVAQVKNQLQNITLQYQRNEKLFKEKVISQAEWDNAKAQFEGLKQDLEIAEQGLSANEFTVKSARASLKEAQENLRRTTIYAPMSGIVTKLAVELGERVLGTVQMTGTEIMRISNLSNMQAVVDVSEGDIVRVSLGDTADITIDAYPDHKFKGVVSEISNSANQSVTNLSDQVINFQVKISLLRSSYADLLSKNPYPFRPGMSSSVEVNTATADNVITVPIQAVAVRNLNDKGDIQDPSFSDNANQDENKEEAKTDKKVQKQEVVFLFEKNGTVTPVKIKTGLQNDTYIEVVSGLKGGEEIISGPYSLVSKKLKKGLKVVKTDSDKLFEGEKK